MNEDLRGELSEELGIQKLKISSGEKLNIPEFASSLLGWALHERASDIHIEPAEKNVPIRFRIDGELKEMIGIEHARSVKLIASYKALASMDLAEKRRPQDGSFETTINNRTLIIRGSTAMTPYGESIVLRLLEPLVKPKSLEELGMDEKQKEHMMEFSKMRQGLVLIVGPTGSGKTTTLYSLFNNIDCIARSLISVEDPVEYRIPHAKQQQVNEKAGVTFESLLRSAVRQDPDILFMGEIRDAYSAKIAIDFASTGHLTLSTMHTANATSAIFRLERLGLTREMMADTLLGIVAQTLIKKLCISCKKVQRTPEDVEHILTPFTKAVPALVALPGACEKCDFTGYLGRTAIFEIIRFYPEISVMVRKNLPIPEIRQFAKDRGDFMIGQHAIEKVRNLILSPKDIIAPVLADETEYYGLEVKNISEQEEPQKAEAPKAQEQAILLEEEDPIGRYSILVVDDDEDTQAVVKKLLRAHDYKVTSVHDGVEAINLLEKERFHLILSDIQMPNLDGLRLQELLFLKGIQTPIIFFTGQTKSEYEKAGLRLGAEDYIKKPVSKEVLLMRIERVLKRRPS